MIHLTLNTGHSMTVPPDKVGREALRVLKPMVVKGGDLIPHFAPWRTVISRGEGHASFDLRRNKQDLVVLNVVAWTPEGAECAWRTLEKHYLDVSDVLAQKGVSMPLELPDMPASLPWLATWILPQAMMAIHPHELGWMADFEQCLAQTILYYAAR
jgi:hypothetical protein